MGFLFICFDLWILLGGGCSLFQFPSLKESLLFKEALQHPQTGLCVSRTAAKRQKDVLELVLPKKKNSFLTYIQCENLGEKLGLVPTPKAWKESDNRLKVKLNTASESQPETL